MASTPLETRYGLDGFSTSGGKLFVVGFLAEAVGIAGRKDDFNVHAGETGDEVVENGLALILQGGLVEVEEHVCREGHLFGSGSNRSGGLFRLAGFGGKNIGVDWQPSPEASARAGVQKEVRQQRP